MSNYQKLKPCPFCSKEVAQVRQYPSILTQYTVLCGMGDSGCGASVRPFLEEKYAAEKWNERVKISEQNEKELKDCPYCGNHNLDVSSENVDNTGTFSVYCRENNGGCGAKSGGYILKDDAIEIWNRRD